MFTSFINPLPLMFITFTSFGILTHDTQLDRATTMALAVPTSFAAFAAVDFAVKSGDHTHVERVAIPASLAGLRVNVHRLQPREDDRSQVQMRKTNTNSGDHIGLWPSV